MKFVVFLLNLYLFLFQHIINTEHINEIFLLLILSVGNPLERMTEKQQ